MPSLQIGASSSPATPGDWHAGNAAIRDIRKMLGLAKTEKTVGQRRHRKARTADAPTTCPTISTLPDYRDDLLMAKYRGFDARELNCALWQACRALLREHIGRLSA